MDKVTGTGRRAVQVLHSCTHCKYPLTVAGVHAVGNIWCHWRKDLDGSQQNMGYAFK